MTTRVPSVHAVATDHVLGREDFLDLVRQLGRQPIAIHVRSRILPGRMLAERVQEVLDAVGRAVVIVNDRADVARALDAAGVHLPSDGLPIAAAREVAGPGRLVGISTHAPDEARAALAAGADYVFLGPIFETRSHPDRAPLGTEALRAAGPGPVIAIGGITAPRAAECRAAGAAGVAAVSALWDADDPTAVASQILLSFGDA